MTLCFTAFEFRYRDFNRHDMLEPIFKLDYLDTKLTIQSKELKGRVLFKVNFPHDTDAVIITRATDFSGQKFWTSLPEGRQQQAEQIGALIEQYYRSKQR